MIYISDDSDDSKDADMEYTTADSSMELDTSNDYKGWIDYYGWSCVHLYLLLQEYIFCLDAQYRKTG